MLHSGMLSAYKIDCDALDDDDIEAIAQRLSDLVDNFGFVLGIPTGGTRLANMLGLFLTGGCDTTLIVDDVFTTGRSMEEARARLLPGPTIGAVIFARSPVPNWITPLCTVNL